MQERLPHRPINEELCLLGIHVCAVEREAAGRVNVDYQPLSRLDGLDVSRLEPSVVELAVEQRVDDRCLVWPDANDVGVDIRHLAVVVIVAVHGDAFTLPPLPELPRAGTDYPGGILAGGATVSPPVRYRNALPDVLGNDPGDEVIEEREQRLLGDRFKGVLVDDPPRF